jgi:hypothetical protein
MYRTARNNLVPSVFSVSNKPPCWNARNEVAMVPRPFSVSQSWYDLAWQTTKKNLYPSRTRMHHDQLANKGRILLLTCVQLPLTPPPLDECGSIIISITKVVNVVLPMRTSQFLFASVTCNTVQSKISTLINRLHYPFKAKHTADWLIVKRDTNN